MHYVSITLSVELFLPQTYIWIVGSVQLIQEIALFKLLPMGLYEICCSFYLHIT